MGLREFRSKYLTKLLNIKDELLSKYPDKSEKVQYLIDVLVVKLQRLRLYTLADYLFTLYQASKEFKEFERLIPTQEEVDELLEGGDYE